MVLYYGATIPAAATTSGRAAAEGDLESESLGHRNRPARSFVNP